MASGRRITDSIQPGLFGGPGMPEGFRYQANLLSVDEEAELVQQIQTLPFKEFEFQGFLGKRRIVSFGWHYDFSHRELKKAEDIPAFLMPLRQKAASFAGLGPTSLQHVLVAEYSPGAGIGWHKDKAVFAEVVGISLSSPCRFRFRRKNGDKWETTPPSSPSRGRRICWPVLREPSGNTASRRWKR